MIIAIGGKIASGKNTVCDIIQYLTAEDSSSECIKRIKGGLSIKGYHNSKFEPKAFAGKLKTIASLLTGVPVERFEDQEFKKLEMPECWNRLQQSGRSKVWVPMTYRQFLQELGTEAMRDGLHTNVWVNALFADYKGFVKEWDEFGNDTLVEYSNWIITDMRFPNEMEAVKKRGGITILVQRPCQECGITAGHVHSCSKKDEILHVSETGLDDCEFNYYISNDGTIEDLIEKVRTILIKEKII
jgi:hypothetical protein